jgi:hypothetical protein
MQQILQQCPVLYCRTLLLALQQLSLPATADLLAAAAAALACSRRVRELQW